MSTSYAQNVSEFVPPHQLGLLIGLYTCVHEDLDHSSGALDLYNWLPQAGNL